MIVRVREWYGGRTRREQILVAAMAAVALPVFAWLLVVLPVISAYEKALQDHLEAVDRNGRIVALSEAMKDRPARAAAPLDVDLQLVVSEAADLAGATLGEVTPAGPDAVSATLANSTAAAAGEWVRSLEARGLVVDDLRLAPSAEGRVNVSARLARR
ncbi:MAG: type II secretion system protein M [Sphingomonas sp.]|nr:type II secretion system protein M [Sphingomonas sp.]